MCSSERVVIVGGGGCRRRGGDGGGGGGGVGWGVASVGAMLEGVCCWSIASVGAMSEKGSCCIFSRMSSGGRIVAMYEESSSRFGTLDGRLRSLGSSEMVNCACSE